MLQVQLPYVFPTYFIYLLLFYTQFGSASPSGGGIGSYFDAVSLVVYSTGVGV